MQANRHAATRTPCRPTLEPDRRLRLYRNRMGEIYLTGPNGLSAWVHGYDDAGRPAPRRLAAGLYRNTERYNDVWACHDGRLHHLHLTPAMLIDAYAPWRPIRLRPIVRGYAENGNHRTGKERSA